MLCGEGFKVKDKVTELKESWYDCFYCVFPTSGPIVSKLCLMGDHHKADCPNYCERSLRCVQVQGHNEGSGQTSLNVCLDNIF